MSAKTFASALVVAVAVGLASASVQALTVTVKDIGPLVDPSIAANNILDADLVGDAFITNTGVPGDARSPWTGLTSGTEREFLYVEGGAGNSITYELGSVRTSGSLIWGSPGTSDTLTLYNGVNVVDTITPSAFTTVDNRTFLVTFTDTAYDKLVFTAGVNSFEFSNVVVPLPAAAVLFLSGLLAMFVAGRRRNRSQIGPHSLA